MHQLPPFDGVPTSPNSPAVSRLNSLEPEASHGMASDWSDFDMISSMESLLPRNGTPHVSQSAAAHTGRTASPAHGRDGDESVREHVLTPSSRARGRPQAHQANSSPVIHADTRSSVGTESSSLRSGSMSSSSGIGAFIMPQLSTIAREGRSESVVDRRLVGHLKLAVCGSSSLATTLAAKLGVDHTTEDSGFVQYTCSASKHERGQIAIVDAAAPPHLVVPWLEARSRRGSGADAIIYALPSAGVTECDITVLRDLQRLSEVVPVVVDASSSHSKVDAASKLAGAGIHAFQRGRAWTVTTEEEPGWDMVASSETLDDSSRLIDALMSAAPRLRATAAALQAQSAPFASPLIGLDNTTSSHATSELMTTEPAGALALRVDLRTRALGSIGNLDPLRLAQWSAVPRFVAALVAGAAAALGCGIMWSRALAFTMPPVTSSCRRERLEDVFDEWSWLCV